MSLVRLSYFSVNLVNALGGPMISQISDIIDASHRNNKPNGVTGALVFDKDWFIQIIEGEVKSVWSTFDRIHHDERHSNVSFVEMKAVPSRRFGAWWMGCIERNASNASLFEPYLYDGQLRPMSMSGDVILSLMLDLGSLGYERHRSTASI